MKKYKTRVIVDHPCSCAMCDKEFTNLSSLSHHISRTHKTTSKEYYDTFLKKADEGICECGNNTRYASIVVGYRMYCSKGCTNASRSRATQILQTKKEIYGENMDAIYEKAKATVEDWSDETKDNYRKKLSSGIKRAIAADPTIISRRRETLMTDPVKLQNFKTSISKGHLRRNADDISKSSDQRKLTNLDKYGVEAVCAHLKDITPEQRQINIAKAIATKIERGIILSPNDPAREPKRDYKKKVRKISEIWAALLFTEDELDNRGLLGVAGAVQLDHIVSLEDCFNNDIPEEIAGHAVNLQLLSWEHNIRKSSNSGMLTEELVDMYNNWES